MFKKLKVNIVVFVSPRKNIYKEVSLNLFTYLIISLGGATETRDGKTLGGETVS